VPGRNGESDRKALMSEGEELQKIFGAIIRNSSD
jgi:hypothetical protein